LLHFLLRCLPSILLRPAHDFSEQRGMNVVSIQFFSQKGLPLSGDKVNAYALLNVSTM
jgi:hypothetical protein